MHQEEHCFKAENCYLGLPASHLSCR